MILRGKRLGFGLDEIEDMLSLYAFEDGEVGQLEYCLKVGRQKIAALELQKQDIEATLEELRGFEERFVALLEQREDERSPTAAGRVGRAVGGSDDNDA